MSKTRMADNACVGGLVLDNNRYVRLLNPGNQNQPIDTDFEVGQIWDIKFIPRTPIIPPHIEDVIVRSRTLVKTKRNLSQLILDRELVDWEGSINDAFDGLLSWTQNGSGYVSREGGFPDRSVGFWVSDQDIARRDYFGVRYRYPSATSYRNIKFVGYQEPVDTIPAGTIIRLSLTRFFSPPNDNGAGYWLQLSGWY